MCRKKQHVWKLILTVVSDIPWGSWNVSATDNTTVLGIQLLRDSIQAFLGQSSFICIFAYE